MPFYQAVVLAVIQGLTEFLPVSSTAHLALFPWLLNWKDPGLTFDLALHAGTLVAVLIYFWRTWMELITAGLGLGQSTDPNIQQNRLLFWYLVIGTIPAALAGWLFEHAAEAELRRPMVIGTALIVVGLLMWAADRIKVHSRQLGQITFADSVAVGIAQAFAVIPGISRSGITMTAGLFRGVSRETAARFSFLLSTPIIAGAALKKGLEMRHEGLPPEMRLPFMGGALVAALVGYLVIAVLIRFLERHTFRIFVVYRLLLGVLVLALGWGLRHA
jgi:undecaprenyl-diphosphatase